MDVVVLDIESQKLATELPNGWNDVHLMGVSCAVLYEVEQDRFRTYDHNDVEALQDRLLKADCIVGWNINKFDIPAIWAIPGRQMPKELIGKTNDLMLRCAVARNCNPDHPSAHRGWGLNSVSIGTLNRAKNDSGLLAPQMFRDGQWGRLINYCLCDVHLTKDLYLFSEKHGYLLNEKFERAALSPWQPLIKKAA